MTIITTPRDGGHASRALSLAGRQFASYSDKWVTFRYTSQGARLTLDRGRELAQGLITLSTMCATDYNIPLTLGYPGSADYPANRRDYRFPSNENTTPTGIWERDGVLTLKRIYAATFRISNDDTLIVANTDSDVHLPPAAGIDLGIRLQAMVSTAMRSAGGDE